MSLNTLSSGIDIPILAISISIDCSKLTHTIFEGLCYNIFCCTSLSTRSIPSNFYAICALISCNNICRSRNRRCVDRNQCLCNIVIRILITFIYYLSSNCNTSTEVYYRGLQLSSEFLTLVWLQSFIHSLVEQFLIFGLYLNSITSCGILAFVLHCCNDCTLQTCLNSSRSLNHYREVVCKEVNNTNIVNQQSISPSIGSSFCKVCTNGNLCITAVLQTTQRHLNGGVL